MIIFNADDYGLTNIDVERVLKSFKNRMIQSTTVVSNVTTEKNLKKLYDFENISTGIHFNLTEGMSLGNHKTITIDNDFLSKKKFIERLIFNQVDLDEIEIELSLQVEKLLDNNIRISHIDTHQNMHFLPPILKIITKVAGKYGIDKIRGLDSEYFWFKKYSKTRAFIKNNISYIFNTKYLRTLQHSQKIIINAPGLGFECSSIGKALEQWDNGLKKFYNPNIIYEVPCHLYLSDFEYELYNSREFFQIIRKNKVKIGCFYDV